MTGTHRLPDAVNAPSVEKEVDVVDRRAKVADEKVVQADVVITGLPPLSLLWMPMTTT